MGSLAVMMSTNDPGGLMSPHFGKAEWVMVVGASGGTPEFTRNEGSNGRSAAEILIQQRCTDVIVVDIGDGALSHLQEAGIRTWGSPGAMAGREVLRMFAEGKLLAVPALRPHARHGHGCCCAGHGDSQALPHCGA